MKALVITLLLLSIQAHAQMNTPFETLRAAFNKANTPAEVHDFDEGTWKNCIFSDIANPMQTRPTQVRTLEFVAQGDNGPLFPGGSDFRIDVFHDYSLDNNLLSFFQHSWLKETQTTLMQSIDGPPWRRMNVYGRKDTDMLLFYVEISDSFGPYAPMYPRVYGYCWNGEPGEEVPPIPPIPN